MIQYKYFHLSCHLIHDAYKIIPFRQSRMATLQECIYLQHNYCMLPNEHKIKDKLR